MTSSVISENQEKIFRMKELILITVFLPLIQGMSCPSGGPDCGARECCVDGQSGEHYCCGERYASNGWIKVNWTPLIIGLIVSIVISIILSVLCCLFCNGCFIHRWRHPDRYPDDGFSMFPFGVMVSPVPSSWLGNSRREGPPSYSAHSPMPLSERAPSSLDSRPLENGYRDHPPASYTSSLSRGRVHFSDDDPYETQIKTGYENPRSALKHH